MQLHFVNCIFNCNCILKNAIAFQNAIVFSIAFLKMQLHFQLHFFKCNCIFNCTFQNAIQNAIASLIAIAIALLQMQLHFLFLAQKLQHMEGRKSGCATVNTCVLILFNSYQSYFATNLPSRDAYF